MTSFALKITESFVTNYCTRSVMMTCCLEEDVVVAAEVRRVWVWWAGMGTNEVSREQR